MSAVLAIPARGAGFAPDFPGPVLLLPSAGASDEAQRIKTRWQRSENWASRRLGSVLDPRVLKHRPESTVERLDAALASAKVMTSNVVMHLDREWRDGLFAQLDDLLATEDWHQDDEPLLEEDPSVRFFG